ncbi:MAG: glycosyltransferase [Thermoanaerobaculia bacterium]|nr:glycosyltransferase [Thermoanaerobaculia bacterium]
MRVGVYVPEMGPESGGAHTFVADVLGALAPVTLRHQFTVLHPGAAPPMRGGLPRLVRLPDPASPLDSTLDATARELGLELVWFLTPEVQPVTVPFVATVWDLEHRGQPHFPEVSVSGWGWQEREFFYRTTLPRAAWVNVGSAYGKRQIESYYGLPAANVVVVPLPTPSFTPEELGGDAAELAALGVRASYLFYPAQFWPHKNHVVLLHALARLSAEGGAGAGLQLVLTGADKGNLAHVRETAAELGVAERVVFLGFVARRTVATLYREAEALVFPSLFGPDNLPPLEAFALGCPVVAAALPGAAEVYDGAARLVAPTDEAAWAAAIAELSIHRDRREELVAAGRRRAGRGTAADYVAAVVERLDAFAAMRRCWSRSAPYRHTS